MTKFYKSVAKVILRSLVIVIILLAIALNVMRFALPYFQAPRQKLQSWASRSLRAPVEIAKVDAYWRGLEPIIEFSSVRLLSRDRRNVLGHIKYLQFKLDVWDSLLHLQLVPRQIIVDGCDLHLLQQADGHFSFHAEGLQASQQAVTSGHSQALNYMTLWLIEQVNVVVRHVNVQVLLNNQHKLAFKNLSLDANRNKQHNFSGEVEVQQPRPAKLSFIFQPPKSMPRHAVAGRLYVDMQNIDPIIWAGIWPGAKSGISKLFSAQYKLSHANWNGRAWLNWQGNQLRSVQLAGALSKVKLYLQRPQQWLSIKSLSSNLLWQLQAKGWRLSADDLRLQSDTLNLGPYAVAVARQPYASSAVYTAKLNQFDLDDLYAVYKTAYRNLLPDNFWQWQHRLQPHGTIKYAALVWNSARPLNPSAKPKPASQLSKDSTAKRSSAWLGHMQQVQFSAEQLAWQPYKKIPGMSGLNLQADMTPRIMKLKLKALSGANFKAPALFKTDLPIDSFAVQVNAQAKDGAWWLRWQKLSLKSAGIQITDEAEIELRSSQSSSIKTHAEFNATDAAKLRDFMPYKIMHPKLATWLHDAFEGGQIKQGQLDWFGPLQHFPIKTNATQKFATHFNWANGHFHYANHWPDIYNLHGTISFTGAEMQAVADSGQVSGAHISKVSGVIKDLTHADLSVQSSASGDLQQMRDFILATPLPMRSGFKPMHLQGPVRLNLSLGIPLSHMQDKVAVNGKFVVHAATVSFPAWSLVGNQASGQLEIKDGKLFARDISASILGHPAKIQISTLPVKSLPKGAQHSNKLQVSIRGRADVDALTKGRDLFFAKFLHGQFPYAAKVSIYASPDNRSNQVLISTQAQGVKIDLPPPFLKSAASKLPLSMRLDIARDALSDSNLYITAGKKWSLAFGVRSAKQGLYIKHGELRLNSSNARIPSAPGLLVSGSVYQLSWPDLQQYLPAQSAADSAVTSNRSLTDKAETTFVRQVDLQVGRLKYNDFLFKNITFDMLFAPKAYNFTVDSDKVDGWFSVPMDYPEGILRLKLQKLILPLSKFKAIASKQVGEAKSQAAFASISPLSLPGVQGSIGDLTYQKYNLGKVTADIRRSSTGLQVNHLTSTSSLLQSDMSGAWTIKHGRSHSSLRGKIITPDTGLIARKSKVTTMLAGGKGNFNFDLHWPGPLFPPAVTTSSGWLAVKVEDGAIIHLDKDTQQKMGLGKLLNLFSLQTLPRRLALNFSDLTSKGYSFSKITGRLLFKNGNADLSQSEVSGPVANVRLTGNVDFNKKYYALVLDVRPHLTSTLPVIAAIAATPIAGIITWVVDKAFVGPLVGRIARKVIHLKGYWDRKEKAKVLVKTYSTKNKNPNTKAKNTSQKPRVKN